MKEQFEKIVESVKQNPLKAVAIATGVLVVAAVVVVAVKQGTGLTEDFETLEQVVSADLN